MRIMLVSNVFPPGFIGGYELGALDVAQALSSRGHQLSVLTSDFFLDDELSLAGLHVERTLECAVPTHQRPVTDFDGLFGVFVNWNNIRRVGSALRRHRPDLILVFNTAGLGTHALIQFLSASAIPMVTYFMDDPFGVANQFPEHLRRYDRIFGPIQSGELGLPISMSRNLLAQLCSRVPGLDSSAVIIPGWVDLENLPPPDSGGQTTELSGHRRFVFSGRVAGHKGVDILIEAAARLSEYGRRNFTIDIYGAGSVGPVMQEVQRRNLAGIIYYKGVIAKSEMVQRFGDYDALLFPTWEREPFGFTAVEAAGRGCIPVMTSAIGAAEWFLDAVDCFKTRRTSESLGGAMLRLIEMPQSRLDAMKARARESVAQSLGAARWMDRIEDICVEARHGLPAWSPKRVRQLESVYLVLSEMFREGV